MASSRCQHHHSRIPAVLKKAFKESVFPTLLQHPRHRRCQPPLITLSQHRCSGRLLAKCLNPRLPDTRIGRAFQTKVLHVLDCPCDTTDPAGPQLAINAPRSPCLTLLCVGTATPLIAARRNAQRIITHTKTDQGLPLERQQMRLQMRGTCWGAPRPLAHAGICWCNAHNNNSCSCACRAPGTLG
jgi:hypothetical protein